ncbi:MAG: sugar nucleotide-binding protein, partial [Bacteroidota bacterium]|nr:sugar nucleotide-binding protein [Bacteroidota bacterium]
GIECSINRVNNDYFNQLHLAGHYDRSDDINAIAALGIKTLRYPILWEKHQPRIDGEINWEQTKSKIKELSDCGITPIAGLLHHGSGPAFTNLLDDNFPNLFAAYAGKVARQFPGIKYYTPINEPLTTARFSGLYGLWFPHLSDDASFVKMLLNQVKGIILAMIEIRKVDPSAKLVQTEDLSKTYSTKLLAYQANFENERRWLTYDLLCGRVKPGHHLWRYFMRLGIKKETLFFFVEHSLEPDIMGFNYYVTSERFLDDDLQNYPLHKHGGNGVHQYVDVEAIRVNHGNPHGLKILLKEAWERYKIPIAITEAHLTSGREDQLRWLDEIKNICSDAIINGIDVRAITFWSLFGAYGWSKLLTDKAMDYEPGAFDLRFSNPKPTAIATYIKTIIAQGKFSHPLINEKGWWHRSNRFLTETKLSKPIAAKIKIKNPLLIIGKTGTLGQAFGKLCSFRNIEHLMIGRPELDINNEKNITEFLIEHEPWAIINAAGFVKVDDAESVPGECFKVNTSSAILLSRLCKERNIQFLTFSSDFVFEGEKGAPYFETDPVKPLNVYGLSKAIAEKKILEENSNALIVRTASFFGPWDQYNFVISVLRSLNSDKKFLAIDDIIMSPTYVPHLVEASLELLIDREHGIVHLSNESEHSWFQFALKIAAKAGFAEDFIIPVSASKMKLKATRPKYSALKSMRGKMLPSLDEAVNCFFNDCDILPGKVLLNVSEISLTT